MKAKSLQLFSLSLFLFFNAKSFNQEHLELAKQNRQEGEIVNLMKTNLSGANTNENNLRNAKLKGAILNWADLSHTDCFKANLENANLASSNTTYANFSNATLSGADLSSSQGHLKMIVHDIAEPTAEHITNLVRTFITTKDLILKKFPKEETVNLLNLLKRDFVSFFNVLNRSVLGTTNKITNPISLNLERGNRICANFANAIAQNTNFSFTYLIGALFENADLQNSNFEGCILCSTNFNGADLRNANFTNTHLEEADFQNADVLGAQFIKTQGLKEPQKVYLQANGATIID